MKSRGISERRVIHTICEPDDEIESFRSRRLCRRIYGGKILEVVTKSEDRDITVVTAYYLENDYESNIRQKN